MWAARGTRADLARATTAVASVVTTWSPEWMQYLTQLMSYAKGSLDVVLVMDARSLPKTLDQWMTDVSADADYRHPKCQTGVFVALSPISAQPSGEHVAASAGKQEAFLPLEWSTHGQKYAKLHVAEGEVVGAVHGGRAGLQWSAVYSELAEGRRADADLDDLEPYSVVRLREDNAACELALKRGYSAAMSYISKIYAVSVAWAGERVAAGEIEVQHEESKWMVADVLTKIMQPVVLFARRILARYVDGQFEF